jgi:replication initiation protein RepC
MVASQVSAKACPPETVTHKWRLFRAITEAKVHLGHKGPLPDRALAVLHALLSFHQETVLMPDSAIVVFPSNKELSIRANGIAAATLRRHLAALVDAGLIIRRDSPNGKRYARKGQGGEIENAFGFDLTPLVARAAEIENLAEKVRAEARAKALLRERITLCRRDIVKMTETGLEEGVGGDWGGIHQQYLALSAQQSRKATHAELNGLAGMLDALAADASKLLESHVKALNMDANESHIERHIQIQNTESFDLEPRPRKGRAEGSGPSVEPASPPSAGSNDQAPPRPSAPPGSKGYPLGMVLEACPDIIDYARHGIHSWRDLIATAALVRSALGVSPDAWAQALEAMGEADASVIVASILQKGEEIKSAGGYLRALTAKARAGEFSVGPVLMALLRGKLAARARKSAG